MVLILSSELQGSDDVQVKSTSFNQGVSKVSSGARNLVRLRFVCTYYEFLNIKQIKIIIWKF